MKKLILITLTTFFLFPFLKAQEFADFQITTTNQGTGTFLHSALSNFTWQAEGTINGTVQIKNDETFDDGNKFEDIFGQADNAENLRIQLYPNGQGTEGTAILSKDRLTINFDEITPAEGWGFCVVDIDVEHCLISATDEFDNEVSIETINDWLIEIFDTDTIGDGLNIPKWDSTNAALLGYNTSEDYLVYSNLVIGGLNDSEAPSAFFMPNIPLKSLIIDHENLQSEAFVSYHFYIAALPSNDASLNSIQINGEEIAGFDEDILEYNIEYSMQTGSLPTISVSSSDTSANVEITQASQLPGTATILVTAEDGVTQRTYTINFTIPTNTIGFDVINEVLLFPNPAQDRFKVQSSKFKVENTTIELYDLTGKKLLKKQIPAGKENVEIDVSQFKSGVYFCKLKAGSLIQTKKMILKK